VETETQFEGLNSDTLGFVHYCRAMAHPARIEILRAIVSRGGHIKGETIVIPFLAHATVMQHLRELKRAGIIGGRIFGARCDFKLNLEALTQFEKHSRDFFEEIRSEGLK